MENKTKKLMTSGQSVSWVWFPNAANLNLTPGTHSIKVIVDNNNAVTGSNETNNTRTERLTCQRPECRGQGWSGLYPAHGPVLQGRNSGFV